MTLAIFSGLLSDGADEKATTEEKTPAVSSATTKAATAGNQSAESTDGHRIARSARTPCHAAASQSDAVVKATLTEIPATYTAEEGDTLISIAAKFYGDPERWRDIYALNSDRLGLGGFLTTGKVLVLPRKESAK